MKKIKILVTGCTERELDLVMNMSESPRTELFCTPQNDEMSRYAKCFNTDPSDIEGIVTLAQRLSVNMAVIDPYAANYKKLTSALKAANISVFAPAVHNRKENAYENRS